MTLLLTEEAGDGKSAKRDLSGYVSSLQAVRVHN